ncbi:TonB-dependent receptor [Pedobacter xixiisoli]|uniref:TonB-linked outer membrane protein, SusC/RagA family n=1 Tax=Pedobacter xixiisoli TaxID=1476464 RepID=A0A285ZYY8_9SPHI|nr:TonB-dependent receptor [Pedobacter xixiisoli]SOD14859.1 TonB-linked outer membrane protein, SusC/RagA family [Pedobacter xixiisoli]
MKIKIYLLLSLLAYFGPAAAAQNLTLNLTNAKFQQVVKEIEGHSKFRFIYDPNEINNNTLYNVNVKDKSIDVVLNQIFKNSELKYQTFDNTIVVKRKNANAGEAVQDGIIVTVLDEANKPIPGVTLKIKNKPSVFGTNEQGKANITGFNAGDVLVVLYIGYKTQEIKLEGNNVSVVLIPDLSKLDEVVVVGYGTSTNRNNVGSISSVTAKDLETQPVVDPLAALQGRASGLMISSNSGLPGGGFNVQLRGANSLTNGNSPLYIVDGVPFSDDNMNQFIAANGRQSALAMINPKDIERIDILKDADATAIYGSRGANGVVLITTKKGQAGNLKVDFGANLGASKAVKTLEMLNTQQFLELRREGFANDANTPTITNAPDLLTWSQTDYNDWQDKLYGFSAPFANYQLSVGGGSDQIKYLFSGNYTNQGDPLPGNKDYNRINGVFNISSQSKNGKFKLNASVNYATDKNNTVPTDLAQYYNLAPNYYLYNPDGSYYWFGNSIQNPYAYMERTSTSQSKSLLANTVVSYQILPELEAKVSFGYNLKKMDQVQTLPFKGFNPVSATSNQASYGFSDYNSYIVEPQLNYVKSFNKHELKVLLGGTWQKSINDGHNLLGTGYASDAQLENMAAAGALRVSSFSFSDYRYQSFFGRINYSFDGKYLLNVSGRRDGSSRFGPGNKYGNFGAIGAGWLFSNEDFLKDSKIISFGKLRASIGLTGNDQIGNYQYLDTWSSSSFPYQTIVGLSPARIFNPTYGWEENTKREIGLELGFLKDRIFFNTTYYNNRSGNQLVDITLAPQTGFSSYNGNLPAVVQNSGWEFDLSSTNINRSDFKWTSSINLSIPKNKLLEYPDLAKSSDAARYVIGESTRIVKGYQFTGVDPATGVSQFLDLNGDNTLSVADQVVLGDLMPKFYGGLNNTISYRGATLSFLFQFVKQEGPGLAYGPLAGNLGGLTNFDTSVLNRWRKAGDITDIPRASTLTTSLAYTRYTSNYRYSSAAWEDASYIRLKNVSLAYDISKWTEKISIKRASVTFNAQNLITWTSFRGLDPEIQGFDRSFVSQANPFGSSKTSSTPTMRTFTFGLQMTF